MGFTIQKVTSTFTHCVQFSSHKNKFLLSESAPHNCGNQNSDLISVDV